LSSHGQWWYYYVRLNPTHHPATAGRQTMTTLISYAYRCTYLYIIIIVSGNRPLLFECGPYGTYVSIYTSYIVYYATDRVYNIIYVYKLNIIPSIARIIYMYVLCIIICVLRWTAHGGDREYRWGQTIHITL